jgi:hypothetical protein
VDGWLREKGGVERKRGDERKVEVKMRGETSSIAIHAVMPELEIREREVLKVRCKLTIYKKDTV